MPVKLLYLVVIHIITKILSTVASHTTAHPSKKNIIEIRPLLE